MKTRWIAMVTAFLGLGAQVQQVSAKEFFNYETPHVHPVDLSPSGKLLAVVNTPDNRVELFAVGGSAPILHVSILVGVEPCSVRFRTERELWVVNPLSDSISIVDLDKRSIEHTIQAGDEPADVIFAGSPSKAYVTCSSENKVLVYSPHSLDHPPAVILPPNAANPVAESRRTHHHTRSLAEISAGHNRHRRQAPASM